MVRTFTSVKHKWVIANCLFGINALPYVPIYLMFLHLFTTSRTSRKKQQYFASLYSKFNPIDSLIWLAVFKALKEGSSAILH